MTMIEPVEYVVKPEGWEHCSYPDVFHFFLKVVRRNVSLSEAPEEWGVCPFSFSDQGFTRRGKLVSLRRPLNRHHAIFALPEAFDVATKLVENRLHSEQFYPMAVRWRP